MSKPNKVNKGNYVQKGRLTPDDMARELKSVRNLHPPEERLTGKVRTPGGRAPSRPRSAPEE